jgi:hypothetical protein
VRFESLKDLGDAVLTEESAAFVTKWLYDRNHTAPYRMFIETNINKEAMATKKECLNSLIGDKKAKTVTKEEHYWSRIEKIMKKKYTNAFDAGLLCFRLLGCNTKYWHYYTPHEEFVLKAFLEHPRDEVENIIENLINDSIALEGITRWILTEQIYPDSNIALLNKVWKPVIRSAARNTIEANRICAINCLERLFDSIPFEYFEYYISNIERGNEERTEEEDLLWADLYLVPIEFKHPKEYSDKAILAKIIGRTKNKKSIPLLEELLEKAPKRDRVAIQELIQKINKNEKCAPN